MILFIITIIFKKGYQLHMHSFQSTLHPLTTDHSSQHDCSTNPLSIFVKSHVKHRIVLPSWCVQLKLIQVSLTAQWSAIDALSYLVTSRLHWGRGLVTGTWRRSVCIGLGECVYRSGWVYVYVYVCLCVCTCVTESERVRVWEREKDMTMPRSVCQSMANNYWGLWETKCWSMCSYMFSFSFFFTAQGKCQTGFDDWKNWGRLPPWDFPLDATVFHDIVIWKLLFFLM